MTDERPRRHPIPSTPDEAEQQGFDDATDWLVEAGGLQSFSKYFTPGVALDSSCAGCRSKWGKQVTIAEDLQRETEKLNEALAGAERAIQAMELGVSGFVIISQTPHVELHFRKDASGWGLFTYADRKGEQRTFVPLLNASRRSRIGAAQALDSLVSVLETEALAMLSATKSATEHAEQWVPKRRIVR